MFLRGWTNDVVALTAGAFEVPPDVRTSVINGGARIEERAIARLIATGGSGDRLAGIAFADGGSLERDALFIHPRSVRSTSFARLVSRSMGRATSRWMR